MYGGLMEYRITPWWVAMVQRDFDGALCSSTVADRRTFDRMCAR